jgi:hypothetical protein
VLDGIFPARTLLPGSAGRKRKGQLMARDSCKPQEPSPAKRVRLAPFLAPAHCKEISHMTVRLPKPASAARILRAALAQKGFEVGQAQALDLVATLYGYNSWYAMQQDPASRQPPVLKNLGDSQFELSDKTDRCQIRIKNVVVAIRTSQEHVFASLWPAVDPGNRPLDDARASFEDARREHRHPDPKLPFYGCKLPIEMKALEFVSSDARALDWSHREPANYLLEGLAEWIEDGMRDDSYDLSEILIECGVSGMEFTGQMLVDAQLDPDGRFTLEDGKEFYLIDEHHRRWAPLQRV